MELAIVQPPQLVEKVQRIEMANKPPMAVAMENLKLRDYPETIRNANTASLVDWLLNLLGVGQGKAEHHKTAFEFINSMYVNYTYQEIKLAFQKYVAGEFNKGGKRIVTQQLNAVVIGFVMGEYEALRRDTLNAYRRAKIRAQAKQLPELTQAQKDELFRSGVIRIFEQYRDNGTVTDAVKHIHTHFKALNKFPTQTPVEVKKAQEIALNELKRANLANPRREYGTEKYLERILTTHRATLSAKVRELELRAYFDSLIAEGKHIKTEI